MINYRKGKERFKPNNLGSLYIKEGYDYLRDIYKRRITIK